MYRKMLVANDGSAGGAKALAGALELARRLDVGLTMICVEELPRFPTSIGEIDEAQAAAASVFEKVVAYAEKTARAQGVMFEAQIVAGHPRLTRCSRTKSAQSSARCSPACRSRPNAVGSLCRELPPSG